MITAVGGLSKDQINQLLRGKGDTATIEVLIEQQYQICLSNLDTLIHTLDAKTSTHLALLLHKAKEQNPEEYKRTLTYPHIAIFLATHVRQLKQAPTNVGNGLAAIAVAAAWRCEVENFEVNLTLDNNELVIPSLGKATLEAEPNTEALVTCNHQELKIETADHSLLLPTDLTHATCEWEPIRTLCFEENGLTLKVAIDDIDPIRAKHSITILSKASQRLDELELKHLSQAIAQAWQLLTRNHYEYSVGISRSITMITPLAQEEIHRTGFYRDGFGGLETTIESNPSRMAQGLLEEFQRAKLNIFNSIHKLHARNSGTLEYLAPHIPAEPVSFNSLVETYYSNFAIAEFWQAICHHEFGEKQFEAYVDYALRLSWQKLLLQRLVDSEELTELGLQLIETIQSQVHSLNTAIPEPVKELVKYLAIDHNISNRLANVVPNPADIQLLAYTWLLKEPCPANFAVHEVLIEQGQPVIGRKIRRLLKEIYTYYPEKLNGFLDNEHFLNIIVPQAGSLDAYVAANRLNESIANFTQILQAEPTNLEAWAGLATSTALAHEELSTLLTHFPEIAVALCKHLIVQHNQKPSFYELTLWLAPVLIKMSELGDEDQFKRPIEGGFYA